MQYIHYTLQRCSCAHFYRLFKHETLQNISNFIFHSYGDHPAIHSFPTRRSSDLSGPSQLHLVRRHKGARDQHRRRRSEEHTSELQSHSDLVCRLLLEKKNKTTNILTG